MRSASQLFFLAAFTLLRPSSSSKPHNNNGGTPSLPSAPDVCAIDPHSIVSDACTSYANLDAINAEISPLLKDVTQTTDFFAYYRLNLFGSECPFWSDSLSMCGNRACAVDTIDDEKNIPAIWRASSLSALEGARAKHPGRSLQNERPASRPLSYQLGEDVDESCVLEDDDECDSRDYCVPEDEGATAKGDYVSLVNNTERFTGYSGASSRMVWDAIYSENCFTRAGALSSRVGHSGEAAQDLKAVIREHSRTAATSPDDLYPLNDECLEQRAFYRIISGMHASISSHICWDYLNQQTGQWGPNLTCYKERLHDHPERVANLYFNYALVARAVAKLRDVFKGYVFCGGDVAQDRETKGKVLQLVEGIVSGGETFDEGRMFNGDMLALKDDFKHRFRNVSRLMDCVGCDKCRLWGKVQTAGYGAALKVLFEFEEGSGEPLQLRRTEVVALVNTLGRLSDSLAAVNKFRVAVGTGDENVLRVEGWPFYAVGGKEEQASPSASDPNPESPLDDDFDFTDLDDDPYSPPQNTSRPQYTIREEILSEFSAVWTAFKYVINSWISFPFQASAIAITEGQRLWNYWLGLPVGPRTWRIQLRGRDEL
jgi:ERO1-like protein beta